MIRAVGALVFSVLGVTLIGVGPAEPPMRCETEVEHDPATNFYLNPQQTYSDAVDSLHALIFCGLMTEGDDSWLEGAFADVSAEGRSDAWTLYYRLPSGSYELTFGFLDQVTLRRLDSPHGDPFNPRELMDTDELYRLLERAYPAGRLLLHADLKHSPEHGTVVWVCEVEEVEIPDRDVVRYRAEAEGEHGFTESVELTVNYGSERLTNLEAFLEGSLGKVREERWDLEHVRLFNIPLTGDEISRFDYHGDVMTVRAYKKSPFSWVVNIGIDDLDVGRYMGDNNYQWRTGELELEARTDHAPADAGAGPVTVVVDAHSGEVLSARSRPNRPL
jgi:hypothetical protein